MQKARQPLHWQAGGVQFIEENGGGAGVRLKKPKVNQRKLAKP
jgi:hypothetical protein